MNIKAGDFITCTCGCSFKTSWYEVVMIKGTSAYKIYVVTVNGVKAEIDEQYAKKRNKLDTVLT